MDGLVQKMTSMNLSYPSEKINIKPFSQERKAVLILGNGFDLCAGLDSKFSSFAKGGYWPLKGNYPHGSLPHHLNQRKQLETWFDLEQELFKYAHESNTQLNISNLEVDQKAFEDIHNAFSDYLKNQVECFEPSSNLPNTIIQFFQLMPGRNKVIFTFNYTDPADIIRKMKGELKVPVRYVHGNLKDDNIILGVGDHNELHNKYHFLYKAMSKYYKSTDIVAELEASDDVFIFGHSMGINDYDYFNNFFLRACESRKGFQPDLRITLFTKSDDEQITIKTRIRELADKKLQRLINMCEFNIISTNNIDNVLSYIQEYIKRAIEEHNKMS